ncbi:MAG: hypothetical protein G01um101425_896, partial [Candidatus Peregrinibacteria bacterium Gr01-1014_25]
KCTAANSSSIPRRVSSPDGPRLPVRLLERHLRRHYPLTPRGGGPLHDETTNRNKARRVATLRAFVGVLVHLPPSRGPFRGPEGTSPMTANSRPIFPSCRQYMPELERQTAETFLWLLSLCGDKESSERRSRNERTEHSCTGETEKGRAYSTKTISSTRMPNFPGK